MIKDLKDEIFNLTQQQRQADERSALAVAEIQQCIKDLEPRLMPDSNAIRRIKDTVERLEQSLPLMLQAEIDSRLTEASLVDNILSQIEAREAETALNTTTPRKKRRVTEAPPRNKELQVS